MTSTAAVLAALDTVRDPELDTSIVELGFVGSCSVDAGTATVRLRLPTYFCAPNFAFLMVADAYDAVAGVQGVEQADIALEDHFAAGEINRGVASRAGFVAAFEGLAEDELDDLRRTFVAKAVLAGQDRAVRTLVAGGAAREALALTTLGDVADADERERLRSRRIELGIASSDRDPLLVHIDGAAVARSEVPVHLRRARTVRVSMEANGDYCRRLLADRYGLGSR